MGLRTSIARGCGLASAWALRTLAHRGASTLPGRVALALDPHVIGELRDKCASGTIVVCGTNGKTTTNNVLARAVRQSGATVLCNWAGANMATGVASALLPGRGADWGVFENDELSTIAIVPELHPRVFVLLNLFRDQLDRSGEIDRVQDVIVRALAASPETTLLYNGDDPLCEGVAARVRDAGGVTRAFGIAESLGTHADRVTGGGFCQRCGAPLRYAYRQYGQLGDYHCTACDFGRPRLDFSASDVAVTTDGVSFDAWRMGDEGAQGGETTRLSASWGGAYMVYNLLAAWAAATIVGVTGEQFQEVLDTYHPENGRLQHFDVDGRRVTLNLAKNPTGFNQNISMLMADERPKVVYVVINDDYNDGKDVSWLWDVDFERLAPDAGKTGVPTASGEPDAGEKPVAAPPPVARCFVGGHRANDMQVRFKYAGVRAPIATSVADMLDRLGDVPRDWGVYVLTNYSALWPAKAELERMGESVR